MRPLGWFIKVLLTVIGRLNFYRKFFEAYLPLNISTPPQWQDPPSPFYQSGTLFHVRYSEPCLSVTPLHLATVTCPSPTATRQRTEVICPLIYNARPVTFNEGVARISNLFNESTDNWYRSYDMGQRPLARGSRPLPDGGWDGWDMNVIWCLTLCLTIISIYINDLTYWWDGETGETAFSYLHYICFLHIDFLYSNSIKLGVSPVSPWL